MGGSPTQASEVALLIVDGVDQLLSAKPSQWETLRKSSKVEVCSDDSLSHCHRCFFRTYPQSTSRPCCVYAVQAMSWVKETWGRSLLRKYFGRQVSLLSVHITSSTSTGTHQACLLRRK